MTSRHHPHTVIRSVHRLCAVMMAAIPPVRSSDDHSAAARDHGGQEGVEHEVDAFEVHIEAGGAQTR